MTRENPTPTLRRATGETPVRHIRVADDVWLAAATKAFDRGETISGVVNRMIREYVADAWPTSARDDTPTTY
jgi:hypothetical protein